MVLWSLHPGNLSAEESKMDHAVCSFHLPGAGAKGADVGTPTTAVNRRMAKTYWARRKAFNEGGTRAVLKMEGPSQRSFYMA